MRLFGYELFRPQAKAENISLDTLIKRLEAIHETMSGISVTPDTAMQSPTVQALVNAVSRRITRDNITQPGFVRFYMRRREGGQVLNNNAIKFLRTI